MRRLHPQKIDTPEYYEWVWAEKLKTRPYYDATRQRALYARVKPGDKIVDLGAGCFGAVEYLFEYNAPLASQVEAWAIDHSYTAQEFVRKKLGHPKNLNYVLSPAESTPFRDSYFDVVMSGELIEHYEDPAELAREMARICKPNGWIILSTVDDRCENAQKCQYPEHLWAFDDGDLARLFSPYGAARYFQFGDYHMLECQLSEVPIARA